MPLLVFFNSLHSSDSDQLDLQHKEREIDTLEDTLSSFLAPSSKAYFSLLHHCSSGSGSAIVDDHNQRILSPSTLSHTVKIKL